MSKLFYFAFAYVVMILPAHAGTPVAAPELDGGTLSGLAAAFTGCYAAFRLYKAKAR